MAHIHNGHALHGQLYVHVACCTLLSFEYVYTCINMLVCRCMLYVQTYVVHADVCCMYMQTYVVHADVRLSKPADSFTRQRIILASASQLCVHNLQITCATYMYNVHLNVTYLSLPSYGTIPLCLHSYYVDVPCVVFIHVHMHYHCHT